MLIKLSPSVIQENIKIEYIKLYV